LLVVLRSIVYFGLTSLIALYVGTALHAGRHLGEAALTTLVAFGALGTITGGRLADHFGRSWLRTPAHRACLLGQAQHLVAPTTSSWVVDPCPPGPRSRTCCGLLSRPGREPS
jgi:FSR family fosmidomycin resistance protein-like MFS transporter